MDELNEVKEALKDMFRNAINNAKDKDGKEGNWITVKGTHVFIPDGANQEEVVKEFLDKKNQEDKAKWKSYDEVLEHAEKQLELVESKLKEKNTPEKHEKLVGDKINLEDKIKYYKSQKGEGKDNPSEGKKGYSLSKEYKNHVKFEGDKESGGYPRKIHKDLESAKKFYEYKKEGQDGAEKQNLKEKGKRGIPVRDFPVIVKNPLGDGFVVATHGLAQKHDLKEVYPVNREDKVKNGLSEIINNCKPETEEDLQVLKGLVEILEQEEK